MPLSFACSLALSLEYKFIHDMQPLHVWSARASDRFALKVADPIGRTWWTTCQEILNSLYIRMNLSRDVSSSSAFRPALPSSFPSLVVCVDCSWTKNQQITAIENAYLTRANVRPDGYCLRCPPFQKRRPVLRRTTPARSFRFRAEKKTLTKRPPTEHPASSESSRHWALHRQSGTPSQPVAKRTNERRLG